LKKTLDSIRVIRYIGSCEKISIFIDRTGILYVERSSLWRVLMTCTKKDIVKEVAARTGFDISSVKDIVQTMFDAMAEGLSEDGNIEIRNFGIFKVKQTPERQARNPKTSEIISVPAKKHISFKPGQLMKERINDNGDVE